MLIEFCFENFASFKDATHLNMMATSRTELSQTTVELPSIRPRKRKLYVNKTAAIYGANASGKSQFIKALLFMCDFVRDSAKKYDYEDEIKLKPFLLDKNSKEKPTSFEITFFISNIKYRYGFEANNKKVISEWFYYAPKGIERTVYTRDIDGFSFPKSNLGFKSIKNHVRDNSLILSTAAQLNNKTAITVSNWFNNIKFYGPTSHDATLGLIGSLATNEVLDILSDSLIFADTGIKKVLREDIDTHDKLMSLIKTGEFPDSDTEELSKALEDGKGTLYRLDFNHKYFDDDILLNEDATLGFEDESIGTIKFIALMALTINAYAEGGVVVVDEFDASMHPVLAVEFVRLFSQICSQKAQLIFTTHNTHLLQSNVLRRDQVWLTNKNRVGASSLDCLSDYRMRKDANIAKIYTEGRVSGTPVLAKSKLNEITKKISCLAKINKEC